MDNIGHLKKITEILRSGVDLNAKMTRLHVMWRDETTSKKERQEISVQIKKIADQLEDGAREYMDLLNSIQG